MMRISSKLPGYVHIKFRTLPAHRNSLCRRLSSQCPPPPPRKASWLRRFALGAALLAGGGAVVYALDEWNLLGDNETIEAIRKAEKSVTSAVSSMIGFGPEVTPQQQVTTDKKATTPLQVQKPPQSEKKPGNVEKPSAFLRPTMGIEDLRDTEKKISDLALALSDSYKKIGKLMRDYYSLVNETIDESSDRLNPSISPVIQNRTNSLSKLLAEEEANVKKFQDEMYALRLKVRESKLEGPRDLIDITKQKIEQSFAAIKDSSALTHEDRSLKQLADKTWEKLEKTRTNFTEELHTLFPSLNIPKKLLSIQPSEVDLFLLYSYLQVKMYQNNIKNLESNRKHRIKRALSSMTNSEEEEVQIGNMIASQVTNLKKEMDEEFKKKVSQLKEECSAEITRQLAVATEAHLMTVEELQLQQEKKVMAKHAAEKKEVLSAAQTRNMLALGNMHSQLKEVEELVKSRSDSDYGSHRAQMVWAACHSVLRSLRRVEPLKSYEEKLVTIKEEVSAIGSASLDNDLLVNAVLRGIPEVAVQRGVFTEEALIERFKKVEKVSKGVALVPEQGGSLPLYLLSWIQSYMLAVIPDFTPSTKKLEQPVPSDLSTLDALHEARYWIDRGDLLQAIKYMNLLQGFSLKVAADWIYEAKVHLETVQAAEALMAHAVSMGML